MTQLLIPLDKSETKETMLSGTRAASSWDRLIPVLNEHFKVRSDEKISGLNIGDYGITVKIISIKP